jgi:hypothetical protein
MTISIDVLGLFYSRFVLPVKGGIVLENFPLGALAGRGANPVQSSTA